MSQFIPAAGVNRESLDWGTLGWLSQPQMTGAKQLTIIDVTLIPGHGHDFHKHPNQEELIFVVKGQIEQWVDQEKRILEPGDSVFIDADVVHASFNISQETAQLLAILGPCVGEAGYELVDVADQSPWNGLR